MISLLAFSEAAKGSKKPSAVRDGAKGKARRGRSVRVEKYRHCRRTAMLNEATENRTRISNSSDVSLEEAFASDEALSKRRNAKVKAQGNALAIAKGVELVF